MKKPKVDNIMSHSGWGVTTNTTSTILKMAIESILGKYHSSTSILRGQWYDGANNMQCELNRLKTLILNDTSSTYYVHYIAH